MESRATNSDLLAAIRRVDEQARESAQEPVERAHARDAMVRVDVSAVRRAEAFAARIATVLEGPGGARAGGVAVRVLVESLVGHLEDFEHDWLDRPEDRLQAMLNLGRSLDESAKELRGNLAVMIAIVLEHRNLLDNATARTRGPAITRLVEDLAVELKALAPEDEPEAVARFEEAVIGNSRTRIFHAITSPHTRRISAKNRVVFASAEAAILEGYRVAVEKKAFPG